MNLSVIQHNQSAALRKTYFILAVLFYSAIKSVVYSNDLQLKFNHIKIEDGLPQNSVFSIVKDKYGFMWFGTWGGVVRYDGNTCKLFRAKENDTTALADNRIKAVITDNNQNIWIETGEQYTYLYKYNYLKENFSWVKFNDAPIEIIDKLSREGIEAKHVAKNDAYIWNTTLTEGLIQINRLTADTIKYQMNTLNPFSISDNDINCIYLDDANNIWVGTKNGGVNFASLDNNPFNYYYKEGANRGLVDNIVRAICIDKNANTWVGSDSKGITIINSNAKKTSFRYVDKKNLNNLEIRALHCDTEGKVWIGTKGGLFCYNPDTDTYTNFSGFICHPNVFDICETWDKNLWIGTFNGAVFYSRKNNRFKCFAPEALTGGSHVRAIIEDRYKNIWIATEDSGLTKIVHNNNLISDTSQVKFIRYKHTPDNPNSLMNNRIHSLTEDENGMIWIGSNLGLSMFDPAKEEYRHFTIEKGLINDLIMGVIFDGDESVWFSHKKGLSRININSFQFQNFNIIDGIQGYEFSENAVYKSATTGKLYFGGTNGLNSFYPDSVKTNAIKPKIAFTELSVMQKKIKPGMLLNKHQILSKSIVITDTIALHWPANTFRINFAALHYRNPTQNSYKYKLQGYDPDWLLTNANAAFASYSQVPPGTYTLKVFASNRDGIWSDKPALLHIRIFPPWWLSIPAFVVYAVLIAGLIWLIYNYLISRIRIRKNKAIHQAKLQFFTEISHEFRTPLTLIIDPLEKLINEKVSGATLSEYLKLMHDNAKHLLHLINQLLDFRKLESGHLHLEPIEEDIIPVIKKNMASFQSEANEHKLAFDFIAENEAYVLQFDESKLNMIMINLLSNAFKFTPDNGTIKVAINYLEHDNNFVKITVSDSGVGIAADIQDKIFEMFYQSTDKKSSVKGSGIGLALTKELVELHGGEIMVQSEEEKGAAFSFTLPLKQEFSKIVNKHKSDHKTLTVFKTNNTAENVRQQILVIDDNADVRKYIRLNFEGEYNVLLAENGRIGADMAIENIPDLIISDVMMPEFDGFELSKQLKTDQRTSHIPIILLTARNAPEAKAEGYETGADAYITKPFNTNVLKSLVKNLLEQRKRLRELFNNGSEIEIKKVSINKADEDFLKRITLYVDLNIESESIDIDKMSADFNMSRSQFYRKIKALTNKSIIDFITTHRMNKALELLASGNHNITETAYRVGYSLPNNFTRAFVKFFGETPTKYLKQIAKDT